MRLEVRKYLFDMHEAVELIVRFTDGQSLEEYGADAMMRSAVERQFDAEVSLKEDPAEGQVIGCAPVKKAK
ncbi:MAG: hypothetical protein QOF89_84 [Acidobacteriota bacterium]|jgi:hypothetical protein|nr:hypothetical protein [Acidobacteriota bacterium]